MGAEMTVVPLVLPRLSRDEAEDACVRAARRAALTIPEHGWTITIDAARAARCGPAATAVTLAWGEYDLTIWCPGEPIDAALNRFQPDLTAGWPGDVAALLIEVAFLPVVTAVERATGRDVRVTGAELATGQVPDAGLALLLDDGERVWGLRLEATRIAVAALLSAWPAAPRTMAQLRFPAAARIGTTRLTLAAVQSLRSGDAVLLEIGGSDRAMLVVADAWLAEARRSEGDWKLDGRLRPALSRSDVEWTMRYDEDGADEAGPISQESDLPVRLAFDAGRLEVTLGELRRLGVGSLLNVGRDPGDLIRISANGRLIGHGTLVDVEGKVAVRIVRMFDHE